MYLVLVFYASRFVTQACYCFAHRWFSGNFFMIHIQSRLFSQSHCLYAFESLVEEPASFCSEE